MRFQEAMKLASEMRSKRCSTDELLGELKDRGATAVESIKALREVDGITLQAAKSMLDNSEVWASNREASDYARDLAERSLDDS